jgi:hypothetical protein
MESVQTVYCSKCKKHVPYHYDPINHGKQLLLSIFTLGLWLPIWFCMVFSPTKLCDQCGGPLWDSGAEAAALAQRRSS